VSAERHAHQLQALKAAPAQTYASAAASPEGIARADHGAHTACRGGSLHTHLRGGRKQCRKRYGHYDSRGRLAGNRPITDRPPIVEARGRIGDWEADTMLGATTDSHCRLSLVERQTGSLLLGKLRARTTAEVTRCAIPLIQQQPHAVHTITSDNGTEFHGYPALEAATQAACYFATPHQAWERGTNENTNGLVRQYAPKRASLAHPTQQDCTAIARQLNPRPRKRLDYRTPEECYGRSAPTEDTLPRGTLHFKVDSKPRASGSHSRIS